LHRFDLSKYANKFAYFLSALTADLSRQLTNGLESEFIRFRLYSLNNSSKLLSCCSNCIPNQKSALIIFSRRFQGSQVI